MFSIVTANYNGEKFLKIFLDSLINQSIQDFKIYMIDNGSKDNSINIIKEYKTKLDIMLIELDKNTGFAEANNLGIHEAMKDENEYIVTLNNDLELEKDCLEVVAKTIKEKSDKYDVFQIMMVNYFDRNVTDAAGLKFDKYLRVTQIGFKENISNIPNYDNDIQGACAGAAVYSKKSLKTVSEKNGDYFDSRFFAYYEDVDLALRLLNHGFKSYLIKDTTVYHVHSGTGTEGSSFKTYYLTRNLFFYFDKNVSKKNYENNKLFYNTILLNILGRAVLRGRFKSIKPTLKGYRDYRNNIKPQIAKK